MTRWGDGWEGPWTLATPEEATARLTAAGFVDIEAWLHDEPTIIEPGQLEDFLAKVVLRSHLARMPEQDWIGFVAPGGRAGAEVRAVPDCGRGRLGVIVMTWVIAPATSPLRWMVTAPPVAVWWLTADLSSEGFAPEDLDYIVRPPDLPAVAEPCWSCWPRRPSSAWRYGGGGSGGCGPSEQAKTFLAPTSR